MACKMALFLCYVALVSGAQGFGLLGGTLGDIVGKGAAISGELTLPRAEGRYKCSTLWDYGYSGPDSADPGRYDNDDPYDKATSLWDTASQVSAVGFGAFWGTVLDEGARSTACKSMGLGYRTPQPCFPQVKGGGSRVHGCVVQPDGTQFIPGTPPTTTYQPGTPGSITYLPGTPPSTSYQPGTPPSTSYQPGTPPSTSYQPGTPPSTSYQPGTPGTITYQPGTASTPNYQPGTPPSTTYTPGTPSSTTYISGQPGFCQCPCSG